MPSARGASWASADDIEEILAKTQRMAREQGIEIDIDDVELTRRLTPLCVDTGQWPTSMREIETMFSKDRDNREWFIQHLKDREKLTEEYGYAYTKYPYSSSAAAPACKEECATCNLQYLRGKKMVHLPYAKCLTDAEATKHLESLRTSTEDNISQLRTYIERFGDTIFRKWQKWNVKQRAAHLSKAVPGMYQHKGGVLREADKEREYDRKLRNLYLLPWMNVEVLSEDPARLACLLHARTTYAPLEWTEFDDHQLDYAFRLWMVDVIYNPHCVVMHGPRFGELISWDTAKFHRHAMMSYPRAALIFEAQKVLSRTLRDIVASMVGPHSGGWQASGRTRLTMLATTGSFTSGSLALPDLSCATPYTKPPKFDIEATFEALQSRLRVAEDELWIMQTDPGAVQEHVSKISNSAAARHSTRRRLAVMDEVIQIKAKVEKHSNRVARGAPLPKEYAEAMGVLDYLLRAHIEALGCHLGHLMLSSGSFNHSGKTHYDERGFVYQGTNHELMQDPTLYHLMQLRIHNNEHSLPIAYHVNALEDQFAKSPKEAKRVDQLMWNIISDMALVDDILTTVRLHRPHAVVPKGMVLRTRKVPEHNGTFIPVDEDSAWKWAKQTGSQYLQEVTIRNYAQARIEDAHAVGSPNEHPYIRLYQPLQEVLRLPIPTAEMPLKDRLAEGDQVHTALRVFWAKVEAWRAYQLTLVRAPPEFVRASQYDIFVIPRLGLEDPWEQQSASLRAAIEAERGYDTLRTRAVTYLPAVSSTSRDRRSAETSPFKRQAASFDTPLNEVAQTGKEKIRTRATPASADITDDLATFAISEPTQELRAVSKTSLTIFTRMYAPIPDSKTTRWVDFSAALAEAGFAVTQSRGSAVSFKDGSSNGVIVFHRPHPDPSIDTVMLRNMGKRLGKWFGWSAETFVEREREREREKVEEVK